MKKYWGILGATLVALTLAGCGNHSQAKSSDSKKVTTHKVVKKSKPKNKIKNAGTSNATTASKTNNTSTEFSNKGFITSWIDVVSGIFFKDNQFIWKYTDTTSSDVKNSSMVVTQGTYSYDSKTQIVTLNVNNQSKTYNGDSTQLEKYYYTSISASPANTTLKLKYTPGNMNSMTPLDGNFGSADMLDRGSDQKLNYDNIVNKFGVQKLTSVMQQGHNGVNSADEFKDFMLKHNFINLNDNTGLVITNWKDKEYTVLGRDDMPDDDSMKGNKVIGKYILTTDTDHTGEQFILGEDNNIYYAASSLVPNVLLMNDPTTYYHMAYGN